MIQAEDRIHRIGQASVCRCLYFVAKGTLDELLWKLLENKFQALGEFVEGKEKMKMVVNKTYHSTHELLRTMTADTMDSEEDDFSDMNSECSLTNVEELGSDLEHEIEELGLSEQKLLDTEAPDNDGSDPETQIELDAKPAAKPSARVAMGTTEDEAICLSDDDEEAPVAPGGPEAEDTTTGDAATASKQAVAKEPVFDLQTATFPQLRVYRLLFSGARYGLVFSAVAGRMVVTQRGEDRERDLGPEAKPHVGDVLVAINRRILPIYTDMSVATAHLQAAKNAGTTELIFAEDSDITQFVKGWLASKEEESKEAQLRVAIAAAQQSQAAGSSINGHTHATPPASDEVIEID